jgi:hypothetical protein
MAFDSTLFEIGGRRDYDENETLSIVYLVGDSLQQGGYRAESKCVLETGNRLDGYTR